MSVAVGGFMTETEMNEKIAVLLENDTAKEHQKRKARRRLQRIWQRQRNDRLLRILDHGGYAPHRGYVDGWFDDQMQWHTGNYIKYPKNSNCQRLLKRETSRCTRRCRRILPKGNYYRRLFDYWWNMY